MCNNVVSMTDSMNNSLSNTSGLLVYREEFFFSFCFGFILSLSLQRAGGLSQGTFFPGDYAETGGVRYHSPVAETNKCAIRSVRNFFTVSIPMRGAL